MTVRRFIAWVAVIAAVHLALTMVVILAAFGTGMARFDNPDLEEGIAGQLIDALASVLPQPAMALMLPTGGAGLSPFVQWAALGANSVAWAVGLAGLAWVARRFVWRGSAKDA